MRSLHYTDPIADQRAADQAAVEKLLSSLTLGDDADYDLSEWRHDASRLKWRLTLRLEGECRADDSHTETVVQQAAVSVLDEVLIVATRCLRERPVLVHGMEELLTAWLSVPDPMERRRRRVACTDALART